MTNATKALIVSVVNSGLLLAITFGVAISDAQLAALGVFVNAVLAFWVHVTRKNSPLRVPEGESAAHHPK